MFTARGFVAGSMQQSPCHWGPNRVVRYTTNPGRTPGLAPQFLAAVPHPGSATGQLEGAGLLVRVHVNRSVSKDGLPALRLHDNPDVLVVARAGVRRVVFLAGRVPVA